MDEAVEAAWQRAVEQWDDAARHEVLLGLVAQHSAFAWAAAKYKARAGDPIADAQLVRLRKSATATMMATATVRPTTGDQPYKRTVLLIALLIVMLVLGLVYVKVIAVNHEKSSTGLPPSAVPATPVPYKPTRP